MLCGLAAASSWLEKFADGGDFDHASVVPIRLLGLELLDGEIVEFAVAVHCASYLCVSKVYLKFIRVIWYLIEMFGSSGKLFLKFGCMY